MVNHFRRKLGRHFSDGLHPSCWEINATFALPYNPRLEVPDHRALRLRVINLLGTTGIRYLIHCVLIIFLDALASLETMFKIQLLMFSRLLDFKSITEYYRVLQSITQYYRVLQSITEYYRVLQSITEYYRVLQSIAEYYKDKSSASTWTNFWACF